MNARRAGLVLVSVAAAVAIAVQGGAAGAATYTPSDCTKTWTGPGGNWVTPSSWVPEGVPGADDVACITTDVLVTLFGGVHTVEGLVTTGGSQITTGGSSALALELVGARGASTISNLNLGPGSTLTGAADIEITNSIRLQEMAVGGTAGATPVPRSSPVADATFPTLV